MKTVSAGSFRGVEADLRFRSAHHDLVQAMKATAPVLASTAQIAQRWVAMHMCSSHFSPEAVELCVATAVSKTSSYSAAGTSFGVLRREVVLGQASKRNKAWWMLVTTAICPGSRYVIGRHRTVGLCAGSTWVGFLRFLHLISTYDWAGQPLMVATEAEMGAVSLRHLHTLHQEARRQQAAPAMCIIAPFHTDLSFGQRHCPTRPLLHRVVVLAKRALDDVLVRLCARFTHVQPEQPLLWHQAKHVSHITCADGLV